MKLPSEATLPPDLLGLRRQITTLWRELVKWSRTLGIDSPANGDVPTWNATLGRWEAGAGSSGAVTTVSGTAPIASSGGTTPDISITAATTSDAGSMSATDKAKLDALATTDGLAEGAANLYFTTARARTATGTRPPGVVVLTDAATIAVDASLGDNFRVTLGGNRTLGNPTNLSDGQVINFRLIQDATGGRTLAYDTLYKFAGGTAPVLTTTASAKDFMSCQYDATGGTLFCVLNKAFA